MLRPTLLASCAAFAFALVPALAHAGGFETGDNGTRALGRSGAYVAGADEPSAMYYNPAALTRVRGTAATLNLHLLDANVRFERSPFIYESATDRRDPEREIQFDPVEQETSIFPAPMAFVSTDFGLDDWTFGIGAWGPPAFGVASYTEMSRRLSVEDPDCGVFVPCGDDRDTALDESVVTRDGGQAYMMTEQSVLLIYPSISAAHLFENANLSIGLTAQLALLFVDFSVGIDGDGSQAEQVNFQSQEKDDFYTATDLSVTGVSATGILGVLWEPTNRIAVGASYRPQFKLVGHGEIDIEFPWALEEGAGLSLSDDSATLTLHMPDVVRVGAAYTHRNAADREVFDLELDVVWERWSVMEYFQVDVPGRVADESGTLQDRAIPRLRLGRHYDDSWSVRLGSDISALLDEDGHGPVFRLGASFETPSSPEEWTNIDFTPFLRVGGSAGISWHVGKFSIDAAYAYIWSPTREVNNGKYDLLTPLWVCEDPSNPEYPAAQCADAGNPGHAVNNGTYDTWSQIVSLGATYGW